MKYNEPVPRDQWTLEEVFKLDELSGITREARRRATHLLAPFFDKIPLDVLRRIEDIVAAELSNFLLDPEVREPTPAEQAHKNKAMRLLLDRLTVIPPLCCCTLHGGCSGYCVQCPRHGHEAWAATTESSCAIARAATGMNGRRISK